MNTTIVIGNLVREPELRFLEGSGTTVAKFTIAVDRKYQKDKNNKVTDFHNVQVWGKLGELCGKYLDKGKKVAVEGELQNNNYEKDGVKYYGYVINASTVQFLSPANSNSTENPQAGFSEVTDEDEIDVPF